MSGESGSNTSTGDAMHGQASETMQGHVNSIKAKLGLDNENSLLGKLKAHTRRKLSELEAARAAGVTAVPGSPDWQAAMKPESFSKGFIRANRTQFLVTASIFSLGLFWLLVIRFVHHSDNVKQTGNSEVAQKALAAQQMNNGLSPTYPTTSFGVPSGNAGWQNGGFGAPNQNQPTAQTQPFSQPQSPLQSTGQVSAVTSQTGAPLPIGTSVPQVYSPYTQQAPGQGYTPMQAQMQPPMQAQMQLPMQGQMQLQPMSTYPQARGGYPQATPTYSPTAQTGGLYPMRTHAAARHQVVVNR